MNRLIAQTNPNISQQPRPKTSWSLYSHVQAVYLLQYYKTSGYFIWKVIAFSIHETGPKYNTQNIKHKTN